MGKLNYQELLNQTFEFDKEKKYERTYELLTENQDNEDENLVAILVLRCYYACLLGKRELGIKILKEVVEDFSFYFPYKWLIKGEEFRILHDDPIFKDLAETCRIREEEAIDSSSSELEIVIPKNNSSKLFLHLHGDDPWKQMTKEYESFLEIMESKIFDNHIIGYPMSSYKNFLKSPLWIPNPDGALELKKHYDKLVEYYNFNVEDITIQGTSSSGKVVLEAIVKNMIDVKNLIFLAPYLPNLEELRNKLSVFKEKDINVYIVCGDKDELCFDMSKSFAKYLDELNVNYKFNIIPGLKHGFAFDIEDTLNKAKQFLNM